MRVNLVLRLRLFLLLLLLTASDAAAAAAAATGTEQQACTAEVLWQTICQPSQSCAFLYRDDGADGIRDALTFFSNMYARFGPIEPYWSWAWRQANITRWEQLARCPTPGTLEVAVTLTMLNEYRLFHSSESQSCADPFKDAIINEQQDFVCRCREGEPCTDNLAAVMGVDGANHWLVFVAVFGFIVVAVIAVGASIVQSATLIRTFDGSKTPTTTRTTTGIL